MKIAKIIDEYSVVINSGSSNGIKYGDIFEIYSPGADIKDPDTGASLGALDFVKAKIVARDVFPKMSVCHSQDRESILTANIMSAFIGRPSELNVAAEDISGGYGEMDARIRVGDLVRKISLSAADEANHLSENN